MNLSSDVIGREEEITEEIVGVTVKEFFGLRCDEGQMSSVLCDRGLSNEFG